MNTEGDCVMLSAGPWPGGRGAILQQEGEGAAQGHLLLLRLLRLRPRQGLRQAGQTCEYRGSEPWRCNNSTFMGDNQWEGSEYVGDSV